MVIRKPAGSVEIIAAISKLLSEVEQLAASEEALDFENLHTGLRRLLHSIPQRRYGLTPQETEEIVQQAWLLFLENRDVIRKARPWLTGTVANLCKQQLGRTRRRGETFPGDEVLGEFPAMSIECDSEIALSQAMAVLDDQSRDLCRLIAIEGYGYDEVSDMMKLPLGSIGPMYLRAKSKMRAQMAA
jgi:RNA polymerase sigma factor (sigma-70 family)